MRITVTRMRLPVAVAIGAALTAGLAIASLAPRDLTKQLEYIDAQKDTGVVVFGTVREAREVDSPFAEISVPYTALTVDVSEYLVGQNVGATLTVYTPGGEGGRLSISPDESEIRVGEKVVYFLRADQTLRSQVPGAFVLDNYGAAFRTQTNRKGQVVVLGEGYGSAIDNNMALTMLASSAKASLATLKK